MPALLDGDTVADLEVALLGGDLERRAVGAPDDELIGTVGALQRVAEEAARQRPAGTGKEHAAAGMPRRECQPQ